MLNISYVRYSSRYIDQSRYHGHHISEWKTIQIFVKNSVSESSRVISNAYKPYDETFSRSSVDLIRKVTYQGI